MYTSFLLLSYEKFNPFRSPPIPLTCLCPCISPSQYTVMEINEVHNIMGTWLSGGYTIIAGNGVEVHEVSRPPRV